MGAKLRNRMLLAAEKGIVGKDAARSRKFVALPRDRSSSVPIAATGKPRTLT
jgi:hypothetical protein